MGRIKPIHICILLMVLGIFTAINSYDLGKRAGTWEIVTDGPMGMKNYRTETDEDKVQSYTEAYKSVGCIVLLIGGIGLVTIMAQNK